MALLRLDTGVASYLLKGHALAGRYRALIEGSILAISFMTFAELWEGAFRGNWGAEKKRALETLADSYVIVGSGRRICLRWAESRALRKRQPIAVSDAWIAATALELGCPLVTNNPSDYRDIPNLKLLTA